MNLTDAVAIVKNKTGGRIPISGRETEHFFIFTSLAYQFDEPLGGSPMFVIDKETGDTGFISSEIFSWFDPDEDNSEEWKQFRHYEKDEIIKGAYTMEAELRKILL